MGLRFAIALALLFPGAAAWPQNSGGLASAGGNAVQVGPAGFRWQRLITPPKGAPRGEACIVLDPSTFANAAPALRDLRLYQDGEELPFAIEESFDTHSLESGLTEADDRSIYQTAAAESLLRQPAGVTPAAVTVKTKAASRSGRFMNRFLLPPHVPVERLRLEPMPTRAEHVRIWAGDPSSFLRPETTEAVDATVDPAHPAVPVTLGANLQGEAQVQVLVEGADGPVKRVVLEMRRRSLCYLPHSSSPLTLYLGGGDAMAAESDSFARTFQSTRERPYATLGPLTENPVYRPSPPRNSLLSGQVPITVAAIAFAVLLLFNAQRLLHKHKGPAL